MEIKQLQIGNQEFFYITKGHSHGSLLDLVQDPDVRNYLHYTNGYRNAQKISSNEIGKRIKKRQAPNVNNNFIRGSYTTLRVEDRITTRL